jgi:hypothetical protein
METKKMRIQRLTSAFFYRRLIDLHRERSKSTPVMSTKDSRVPVLLTGEMEKT